MGGLIICRAEVSLIVATIFWCTIMRYVHIIWRPCNNEKGCGINEAPRIYTWHASYTPVNHGYCCANQPTPWFNTSGANCDAGKQATFPTTSHAIIWPRCPIILLFSSIINLTHSSYSLCPPFILPHYNTKSLIKIMVPIPTQIST